METVTVKTTSGFECEIDEGALDDYELFELLCELDKGKMQVVPDVLTAILGKEGKEALKAHRKALDGRVKVTALMQELTEIINGLNSKKK